jgi:hypothetical protein
MNDLLRQLAEVEPGDAPVLSIYLDMRPEATGESPGVREGRIVLRDRLREIRRTFLPRGPELDSFDADAERINDFVDNEMAPSTEGLAIIACHARGVWETLESGVPFENQVSVGPAPDLYQLARLADDIETYVVALIDTNTARFFVRRLGVLHEVDAPDDDPVHYQKRQIGGWSQKRYQRHIEKHRADFTELIGRDLARLVEHAGADHVIIAGDEVGLTHLMAQLPREIAEKTRATPRADMRSDHNDVEFVIRPTIEQVEAESGASIVDLVVAELQRDALGVAGDEHTRQALANGQVDTLLLDDTIVGEDDRAEFVRQAALTSADIEVVHGDERMVAVGGVAALLRYRY